MESADMEEIRTGTELKRWMQALVLAALLWVCPVSLIWEARQDVNEVDCPGVAETLSDTDIQIEKGKIPAPKLALTFDDGPSAEHTPKLLDGLKERGVRATFFVIGANIEKEQNTDLIRRMQEEGHLVGNHTYHHVDLSDLSAEEAQRELDMTELLIEENTGAECEFVRPPFGKFPEGMEMDDKLYVKWTVDSRDWVTKNVAEIVREVVTDTGENDIILMHDCYGTSVEAALQIVDIFQEKGYEFVTLDEILMD